MPESIEKHFAQQPQEEPEKQRKTLKERLEERKEEKALELARKIKEIQEKMEKEGETIEGYQKIIELTKKIKALYEKRIIGWKKEGELGEKDIIAKYKAGGWVQPANFSPDGEEVVIGSGDGMLTVISLTETEKR